MLLLITSVCLQAMRPAFPALPVPPAIETIAAARSSWLQPTLDISRAVEAAITDVNKTLKLISEHLSLSVAKVSDDLKAVTKIITDQVNPITDTVNRLNANLDTQAKSLIALLDNLNTTLKNGVKVKATIDPLTINPATIKNVFKGASGLTLVGVGSTLIYKELTKSQGISTNQEKPQKNLISTCKQLLHNRYIVGMAGIASGVCLINSIK